MLEDSTDNSSCTAVRTVESDDVTVYDALTTSSRTDVSEEATLNEVDIRDEPKFDQAGADEDLIFHEAALSASLSRSKHHESQRHHHGNAEGPESRLRARRQSCPRFERRHLRPDQIAGDYVGIISMFFEQIFAGEPIMVHGFGDQTRDFVFIIDVVQANLKAAEPVHVGEASNTGTSESITIREFAEWIRTIAVE